MQLINSCKEMLEILEDLAQLLWRFRILRITFLSLCSACPPQARSREAFRGVSPSDGGGFFLALTRHPERSE